MVCHVSYRIHMVPYPIDFHGFFMVSYSFPVVSFRFQVVPSWFRLLSYTFLGSRSLWFDMVSYWFPMVSLWSLMVSSWSPMVLLRFMWLPKVPSQNPPIRSVGRNRNKCSIYYAWIMRESYFEPLPNFPPSAQLPSLSPTSQCFPNFPSFSKLPTISPRLGYSL